MSIYIYASLQCYTILYRYSGKPFLNKRNVCDITTLKCGHPTGT